MIRCFIQKLHNNRLPFANTQTPSCFKMESCILPRIIIENAVVRMFPGHTVVLEYLGIDDVQLKTFISLVFWNLQIEWARFFRWVWLAKQCVVCTDQVLALSVTVSQHSESALCTGFYYSACFCFTFRCETLEIVFPFLCCFLLTHSASSHPEPSVASGLTISCTFNLVPVLLTNVILRQAYVVCFNVTYVGPFDIETLVKFRSHVPLISEAFFRIKSLFFWILGSYKHIFWWYTKIIFRVMQAIFRLKQQFCSGRCFQSGTAKTDVRNSWHPQALDEPLGMHGAPDA